MNDVSACSPQHGFKLSSISILTPRGEGLRGEEEQSDQEEKCKPVTGLGFLILKSLFTQNLQNWEFPT